MNKYRIVYRSKTAGEGRDYGELADELQILNKSLLYAYVNDIITLEEYARIKRSIALWIEDIEK